MFQENIESQWCGCRLVAPFVSHFVVYQDEKFLKLGVNGNLWCEHDYITTSLMLCTSI